MKTEHTPEPWHSECATVFKEIGDHRYEVAICAAWSEETFPNARRIVACVNACAGIETELLEIIQDNDKTLAEVIANVEKQRDELLAALENCRLLAARKRNEEWAGHVLRFCADAGVNGEVMRDA